MHPISIDRSALLILFTLAVLLITPSITVLLLRRTGWVRENYRGDYIPAMFGLSIVVSSTLLLTIATGKSPHVRDTVLNWILLIVCFGTLGFIDDRWGDKRIKGIKGHLRAAARDHRITSGLIKAIGGLVAGFVVGYMVYPIHLAYAVPAGLIIALSANALNLFDLRPGRAGAVFLVCSTILLASALSSKTPQSGELLLVFVALPALPAWILDSRAKVMLGDTGSNVLGAALGLAVVESRSIALYVATLVLLIGLHVVAERRSITEIIANNKALNALDKLTGRR